jgi:hypothetical protein
MDSTSKTPEQGRTWVRKLPLQEGFDRNQMHNKLSPQIAQHHGG